MTGPTLDRQWWKEAVVYQVYPRSFNDSDGDVRQTEGLTSQPDSRRLSGDGVGDIPGIVEKVDYLDDLGVDVVWLNPVYESPNVDNGYDVADYRSIGETFGTMDDWEELRDALHERDIRLIMDLVVNHTSDEHEWFQRALAGDDEYRDYYIWAEGRDLDHPAVPPEHRNPEYTGVPEGVEEAPPNNWESFFGGPAWSYDEASGEWYLHLFDERQPDLNWETDAVRREIFDMMEWWLEKGIDGFRMDVVNLLSKPEGLPDGDGSGVVRGADQFVNGPRIHEYLSAMYDEVLSNYDVMTVGEMVDLDIEEAGRYLYPDGDGMSMAFTFDHMRLDFGESGGRWTRGDWSLTDLKRTITHWQEGLEGVGWNSVYLNNHDQPRMVSRFGDDGEYRRESATLLATMVHTLRGTPYVYQGEELGMTNYPYSSLDEVRDVDTLKNVRAAITRGEFESEDEALDLVRYRSRDNARTPMQWTGEPRAGFTDGEPWIPVNPNHDEINAEAAMADDESVWHYYRDLIALRDEHDVLVYGDYDLLEPVDDEDLWCYSRTLEDERLLVVLNFAGHERAFDPPAGFAGADAEVLVSNYDVDVDAVERGTLRPWEARVYRLD